MRTRSLLLVSLLVACAEEDASPAGPGPVPEVWGPNALEDLDPTRGVVQVFLTAQKSKVKWVDEGRAGVWAYDDQLPGPLIQARVGDLLKVHFTNDLPEPTTIHWHGLRIPNEMDGVPAIQEPIQPGESFTYEFVLPDAGSYWYHPHVRSHDQIERGLYGALVVHELEPPTVDKERFFVLDDVLLDETGDLWDPGLIVGMDGMHGRHGNVLLANGSAELLEDTIERGTRERWRVVNTANARTMWIDVTGAKWRVIAVDGTLLEEPWSPKEPLLLPVGRRFDLEVIPREAQKSAKLVVKIPETATTFADYPVFKGTLTGSGAAPDFLADLRAPKLDSLPAPTQELIVDLGARTSNGLEWTINGQTYGEGSSIPVQGSKPTVIEINERSGAEHPFHLHGQFFQVVDRTRGEVVPGLLDTLLIEPNETVHVQSDFDNPGIWMAHCHILEHAELGMMTEFDVTE